MASVNKVIIVGNLGRDPEVRSFPSGDRVANVTVATTDKWKDKQSGEPKEHTEWHRLVFNGRATPPIEADNVGEARQWLAETPNLIGYLERTDITSGMRVLLRLP